MEVICAVPFKNPTMLYDGTCIHGFDFTRELNEYNPEVEYMKKIGFCPMCVRALSLSLSLSLTHTHKSQMPQMEVTCRYCSCFGLLYGTLLIDLVSTSDRKIEEHDGTCRGHEAIKQNKICIGTAVAPEVGVELYAQW